MFQKKPFLLLKYEFLLRERITKFLSVKNDVMFLLYTKVFPLHTTYIYNTGVKKIIVYCFSWSFRFSLNEFWRKNPQVLKFHAFFKTLKADKMGNFWKGGWNSNVILFFVIFLKKEDKDIICSWRNSSYIQFTFDFFWIDYKKWNCALNFSNP